MSTSTSTLIYMVKHCKSLPDDLENVSTQCVDGDVDMKFMNLKTLTGIGKKCFTEINGKLTLRETVKSNALGLLLIKGLTKVVVYSATWLPVPDTQPFHNAIEIINTHLSGDRDVMECHEELTRAGLKEFAKF